MNIRSFLSFFLSFRRFYYQCFACQKNILRNDLIQRAKSNMYHAECFRCEACRKCLQAGDGKTKQNTIRNFLTMIF